MISELETEGWWSLGSILYNTYPAPNWWGKFTPTELDVPFQLDNGEELYDNILELYRPSAIFVIIEQCVDPSRHTRRTMYVARFETLLDAVAFRLGGPGTE